MVILLDQDTLLESEITTNYTISLAWSSGIKTISKEDHYLQVFIVDQTIKKEFYIDTTNDTSTVIIRFNRNTQQISIGQNNGTILRD